MVIAKVWIGREIRYYIEKLSDGYRVYIGKPSDSIVTGMYFPTMEQALDEVDKLVMLTYGLDGIEEYRLTKA